MRARERGASLLELSMGATRMTLLEKICPKGGTRLLRTASIGSRFGVRREIEGAFAHQGVRCRHLRQCWYSASLNSDRVRGKHRRSSSRVNRPQVHSTVRKQTRVAFRPYSRNASKTHAHACTPHRQTCHILTGSAHTGWCNTPAHRRIDY